MNFSLKPFPGEEFLPDIRITGTIGRRADTLSVGFVLRGDLSGVSIPAPAPPPERKDRLWEGTCLEFFLGMEDSGRYWEFNLSPAGHWNVYRFTSYREEMREETAITSLPFHVAVEPDALRLSLELALGKIIPAGKAIEVAVCAVIRTLSGKTCHWAVAHPGPRPDFHRRDGFFMKIPWE